MIFNFITFYFLFKMTFLSIYEAFHESLNGPEYNWRFTVAVNGSADMKKDIFHTMQPLVKQFMRKYGVLDSPETDILQNGKPAYQASMQVTSIEKKEMTRNKGVFDVEMLGNLHAKKWKLKQRTESDLTTTWLFELET